MSLLITLAAAAASLAQGPPGGAGQLPAAAANRQGGPAGGAIADPRRASPQTGTGRLHGPQGAPLGRSADRGRSLFERRGEAFGRSRSENPGLSRSPGESRSREGFDNGSHSERIHPAQSQRPWAAEHVLQNRLAAIDRMRDHALTTDNLDLLQHADELERLAREQHARMIGVLPQEPISVPGFTPLPPASAPPPLPSGAAPSGAVTAQPPIMDPAPLPTQLPGPYIPPGLYGREFGQHVSEQARLYGREFGQYVSEQAQAGGAPFGRGIDRRMYEPPVLATPPAIEPAVTEPIQP
jgi:hypothetical protein